jgi:hypothetical protein
LDIRYLIPAPHPDNAGQSLTVLNPVNYLPLPQDGARVEMDNYWYRRLSDGDVFEGQEPRISPPAKDEALEY